MTHPCHDSFVMHGVTFRKVRDDGPSAATYQVVERIPTPHAHYPEAAKLAEGALERWGVATTGRTRSDVPNVSNPRRQASTDAELLQHSAETGIEELGKVCYEAWLSIAGSAGATAWQDLPPFSRVAWRHAAQAVWDMAR